MTPSAVPQSTVAKRAGVAMMDDRIAVIDQSGTMFGHALVEGDIFIGYALGFFQDFLA